MSTTIRSPRTVATSIVLVLLTLSVTLSSCTDPFTADTESPSGALKIAPASHTAVPSSASSFANRLFGTSSAYLRAAASQPVSWQPFDAAAFQLAQELDRPILLDVSVSDCHWCSVMDQESYGSAEIAGLINRSFVPIKVDAGERPDLDRRFQQAAQLLNDEAGWPLTLFLTPDGRPFAGGTYFGATTLGGRPSLSDLVTKMALAFEQQREAVDARGSQISDNAALLGDAGVVSAELDPSLVDSLAKSLLDSFDFGNGGFGQAGKFADTQAIEFALQYAELRNDPQYLAIATRTLDAMAAGAIRDQLGGGFHRYTLDPGWQQPHFEIVGSLNGALMEAYLHAYQATGEDRFRIIAERVAAYLDGVLADHASGGFYAGQNPDVGLGDDGGFYTWTAQEIRAALPAEEADVILRYFGLPVDNSNGDEQSRRVALRAAVSITNVAKAANLSVDVARARLEAGRAHLTATRNGRPAPAVDRSFLVDRNGMLASAFFEGNRILARTDWRNIALRTVDRLLSLPRQDGLFAHSYDGNLPGSPGLLDDQTAAAAAFLDAYSITADRRYLIAAGDLLDRTVAVYGDSDRGGFYDVASPPGPGIAATRQHPYDDGLTLGGNPLAVLVLDRYAALSGDSRYRALATDTLRAFAGAATEYGVFASGYGFALDRHLANR